MQDSPAPSAETFIALFRGINVGGNSILPMRELVDVFGNLGLSNVKTYIQSGNVVFQSEYAKTLLPEKIAAAVTESHGFTPKVLILTQQELADAAASNPFLKAEHELKTLHLFFLAAKPDNPDIDILERLKTATERFKLTETVFYLHAPDGIGRSKLAAKVEKALGISATARNWQSVQKILSLAG